jgi:hypothetical protein
LRRGSVNVEAQVIYQWPHERQALAASKCATHHLRMT